MAQRTESRDVSGENTADAIDPDDEAGKKRGQRPELAKQTVTVPNSPTR